MALVVVVAAFGCARQQPPPGADFRPRPGVLTLEQLRAAPFDVQQAYRFALANQELLSKIPCYCGCVGVGHRNNLDCYVREFRSNGEAVLDNHGYG